MSSGFGLLGDKLGKGGPSADVPAASLPSPGWYAVSLPPTLLPGTFGSLRTAFLTAEKERRLAQCISQR